LLGGMIYNIRLGLMLPVLQREDFGSGHLFDPINKKIILMTQNKEKVGHDEKVTYGLFQSL